MRINAVKFHFLWPSDIISSHSEFIFVFSGPHSTLYLISHENSINSLGLGQLFSDMLSHRNGVISQWKIGPFSAAQVEKLLKNSVSLTLR